MGHFNHYILMSRLIFFCDENFFFQRENNDNADKYNFITLLLIKRVHIDTK